MPGMTSAAEELPTVSFGEYLLNEQEAPRRHEFVGGRVYAMAGGSERHELAAMLVSDALRPGARAAGCRSFVANRMLRAAGSAYYPDFLIVCGPAEHRLYEADASLIVEILSASTQDHDRREKAMAFSSLTTLRHYLLVDPERTSVEVAQLTDGQWEWQKYGPGRVVVTTYGVLDLDQLYAALDAEATT